MDAKRMLAYGFAYKKEPLFQKLLNLSVPSSIVFSMDFTTT